VKHGLWATQTHNEGILNQAYRTSEDVSLIFSANRSGEFFGYARMSGLIQSSGDSTISSAARTEVSQSSGTSISSTTKDLTPGHSITEEAVHPPSWSGSAVRLLPRDEHRFVDGSPQPLTPDCSPWDGTVEPSGQSSPGQKTVPPVSPPNARHLAPKTAPPELHEPHHKITVPSKRPGPMPTISGIPRAHAGTLAAAMNSIPGTTKQRSESTLDAAAQAHPEEPDVKDNSGLGTPFSIQWIKTNSLSFQRTRHLRNMWNHDREIKVSRDGTELEPGVGKATLEEWDNPSPEPLPTGRRDVGNRQRRQPQWKVSGLGAPTQDGFSRSQG